MDKNSSTPSQETLHNPEIVLISTPTSDAEIEKELHRFDLKERIIKAEKLLLRFLSIAMLTHGLYRIYGEMIEIFYIFPHLPVLFEEIGYEPDVFKSLYQKSVLVTATAAIETIYAIAILSRMKHLAHRLHIFSGICLFIISFLIMSQNHKIESFDTNHNIPKAPTVKNLIEAKTIDEKLELFRLKPVKDSKKLE